ncbi:MAG: hypothetical protein ACREEM_08410 [Blastocatellia bacterium]
MTAKSSRRLVIDASVARASGGPDAVSPTSKHCSDFLQTALVVCHQIVLTTEILEEWHRHESKFASRWLASMFARKNAKLIGSAEDRVLRRKISRSTQSEKARAAMLKDVHLLEAALAADEIVVALDEIVRELFAKASTSVGEIKAIVWVNPDKADEESLRWLENGAKADKKRTLWEKK